MRSLASRVGCAFALFGCSSSPALSSPFAGTWNGTETVVITCGSTSNTYMVPFSIDLVATTYGVSTTPGGCLFEYSVSGNKATLSNGPVVCNGVPPTGGPTTFAAYTITLTDSHDWSGSGSGTVEVNGASCPFMATITASM